MSVCIVTIVVLPVAVNVGVSVMSGAVLAAVTAAASSMGLNATGENENRNEAENSVDFCLDNAAEVTGDINFGQALTFSGEGVKVVFYVDENGHTAVRVSGRKSKAELKVLGEALAKKTVQLYAYNRLVTEMKAKNMNVVDEEVEADGSIRLQVRIFQ
ncbi:MAG: DUF1257 domain-containing protein [Planctomycetes bacterium]|nr:DUF1257 domain-containing protein [Planctomycetota bacterium]